MSAVRFHVGERVKARNSWFVPEGTCGTILQALLSVPDTFYVQFDGYAPPKLMRARDLERVAAVPWRPLAPPARYLARRYPQKPAQTRTDFTKSVPRLTSCQRGRAAVPLPKHSQVLIHTFARPAAQLRAPLIVGEGRVPEFLKDESIFLQD
jgi:hypothetical protein